MGASVNPVGQVEPKRVHPFFAPDRSSTAAERKENVDPLGSSDAASDPTREATPPKVAETFDDDLLEKKSGRKTKRRKVDTPGQEDKPEGKKKSKGEVTKLPKAGSSGANIASHFAKLDKDPENPSPTPTVATKTTHPFFLGKAKAPAEKPVESTTEEKSKASAAAGAQKARQLTSTPCSPKKSKASAPIKMPQFGMKNAGLKFAGAKPPAWPWKGAVHVRGEDDQPGPNTTSTKSKYSMRKSKGYAVTIPAHESLMTHVTAQMDIPAKLQAVRDINGDDFAPAPPQLRLPQKHFESGSKLQQRILGELSCRSMPQPSGGKKLMSKHKARVSQGSNPTGEHQLAPQIAPLFESIRTGLSAFDKSQCENAMWTQKYAPTSASEVLQPGREAFMLRDWLQALIVQSVHTGSGDGEKPKKGKSSAPKKKKKKKLDDFIVSSDEEDNEMNEVSDNEADWLPSGGHGIMKKTVVRSGDLAGRGSKEGTRVTNIVVISGPHGCGKTAAVYAAAKELDFEVFEINSSSRRSGKDIMERIGDMTTNHLVQHRQVEEQDQPAPAAQDETEKEVKSGKQATMNAFFKATPATAKAKKAVMPAQVKPEKEAKAEASSKSQKQSLILLDEADILYDKDQQFWTTIVTLAAQSKRPFIITCNDETLLPLQSLALHAIMRFSPPPVSLAVDRLLLIAANEGHALKRQPVEALYKSRHQDLRAATTDLNYWCQIGTGDRRGGFEWFYPRWPKGVDLDENKEVVRVVSEDTYQRGMNWLGRDSAVDLAVGPTAIEEELLALCWDSWQLDLEHWHASEDLSTWANSLDDLASAPASDKLAALDAYGMLADAMSAADLCSYGSFGLFKQESIDATLPPLPDKAREDFICGLRPLDTPLLTRYNSLATSIPCAIKSLSQSSLRKHANTLHAATVPALPPLEQPRLFNSIENRFTTIQPYTPAVARIDFAFAFDPIAVADTSSPAPVTYLDPSVFDRTLKLIVLDVAPYVRGIVAYETYLQKQREKLSSVLGEGGKNGQGRKRMRTTRAALSALEGGSRSTTRGERWFKADMNPVWVMKTAGDAWGKWVMDLTVSPPASPARSAESSASESPPESKGRKRKVKARVVQDDSADELA